MDCCIPIAVKIDSFVVKHCQLVKRIAGKLRTNPERSTNKMASEMYVNRRKFASYHK